MNNMYNQIINNHISLIEKLKNNSEDIINISNSIAFSFENKGKLFLCGNGGSAADAQHIAAEFVGRFVKDRKPLPAIALTTDTSALTCIGNDYSFDDIFSRQITALGNEHDILIAISTSGNSQNIINAILAAKKIGIKVISLLGNNGGLANTISDISIIVPSNVTARIQEAHILIGHIICTFVEMKLNLND
jgi:D-sedoheptulose 7-phosphate isomerase